MEKIKEKKYIIFDILKAILLSLIIGVILTLLVTVVLNFVPISDKILTILNIVIKILAVFCGCLFGFKEKKAGIIKGFLSGIVYALLNFIIFGIIEKNLSFSGAVFVDIGLCAAIGAICGILSVNLSKK